MRVQTYFLGSGLNVLRAIAALKQLTFAGKRQWVMTLEPVEPHHSDAQRKKLRAMEGELAEHTGNDSDELHEILLARRFGIEEVNLGGGTMLHRPARRTSDLSRSEMAEYITWVQAFAAREAGLELA
jgi:hypothetical protein